jgi:hypothetical protein
MSTDKIENVERSDSKDRKPRLCDNACGTPAIVHDIACDKFLCWLHFVFEHPTIKGHDGEPIYRLLDGGETA